MFVYLIINLAPPTQIVPQLDWSRTVAKQHIIILLYTTYSCTEMFACSLLCVALHVITVDLFSCSYGSIKLPQDCVQLGLLDGLNVGAYIFDSDSRADQTTGLRTLEKGGLCLRPSGVSAAESKRTNNRI